MGNTPELMQKLAKNPRVVAGMKNPYYMRVMQELQTDPQGAMRKCQDDPGLRDFIQEWIGMMGGDFEKLGGKEEKEKKKAEEERKKAAQEDAKKAVGTNPISGKEIRWDTLPDEVKDEKADKKVQDILANQELAACLNDPEMHQCYKSAANQGQCSTS